MNINFDWAADTLHKPLGALTLADIGQLVGTPLLYLAGIIAVGVLAYTLWQLACEIMEKVWEAIGLIVDLGRKINDLLRTRGRLRN